MKGLTLLLLFGALTCFSQEEQVRKISEQIATDGLKKNLFYLASDKLEGRLMGSRGDTLASLFIADNFKANNLAAPYDNGKSYYQAVTTYRKEVITSTFNVGEKQYDNWYGWSFQLRSTETVHIKNIPVVFVGYAIDDKRYNDFEGIDVNGKAVLMLAGQPKDSSGKYYLSGKDRPAILAGYQSILKKKGAVLVLICNYKFSADSLQQKKRFFLPVYKNLYGTANSSVPAISLSEERANELLASSNTTIKKLQEAIDKKFHPQSFEIKNKVSVNIEVNLIKETAPNVIGIVKGADSTAGCIILSAHHDHDGKNGDKIYYGAVDNASGTVAIMEIARLMNAAVQKGIRPKRSVVFASYTGEERGLLGSYYFAANPVFPIEKTWGVLNIDMMGRVDTFYSGKRADSNYAYILVKDSLDRGLRSALYAANEASGKLKLDTYYEQPQFMQRRLMGSDQYPFFLKGVPFVRIDCGFSKDYHQLTDTPDKINYELLSKQIQLAFLTAWNMANK